MGAHATDGEWLRPRGVLKVRARWYPENLAVTGTVTSEARLLRIRRPRTFIVGRVMRIQGELRNAGTTPMPINAPGPWGWDLTVRITWANGPPEDLTQPIQTPNQLQPGDRMPFGPVRIPVKVSGPFKVEVVHPVAYVANAPPGQESPKAGRDAKLLRDGLTALTMDTIYAKRRFWAAVIFGALSAIGVIVGVIAFVLGHI
jgi:hypothetical protein